MSVYHHISANTVSKFMLQKWKDGNWLNNFISQEVTYSESPAEFPSPDADFQDFNLKTKISIEFKPFTESKRGIMTGLGQSIAYLKKAHASYLVSPSTIDGFDMSGYLKDLFDQFIVGRLPIGLVIFDGENLDNIRLECNISESLSKPADSTFKGSNVSFWAIWREISHHGIYKFLNSADIIKDTSQQRADKVWDYFFDNYFAPDNTRTNIFDPVPNEIYLFGLKKKMTPFEDIKKEGFKIFENNTSYAEILTNYVEKRNAQGEKIQSDSTHYLAGLSDKNSSEENAKLLIENKSWSKNVIQNIYVNYEKNFRNFMRHAKLLGENYVLTKIGHRFIERCNKVLWNANNYANTNDLLNDELACILLVSGKHHNLILDIVEISKNMKIISTKDNYLDSLYETFDKRGYIAKNSERKETGVREFLAAERQIWGKLNLINKRGRSYFVQNIGYEFNTERIETLVQKYYEIYSDVDDQLENDQSEVLSVA